MNKQTSNKFSPEVRERAVPLVQEHRGEYPSLWAVVVSIAPKIGCQPNRCWTGCSATKLTVARRTPARSVAAQPACAAWRETGAGYWTAHRQHPARESWRIRGRQGV